MCIQCLRLVVKFSDCNANRTNPALSRTQDHPGLIVRSQSGFFTVQTESGALTCHLRGRLKQGKHVGDIAAVGDRVQVTCQPDGTGSIEAVEPRRSSLVRLDPRPQGVYQQVILANPDQAVFVFACARPTPRLRMLDRFLVIAEKQRLPAIIVANKIDLVGREQAEKMFGFYPPIGYPVIYTCAKTGQGVEELRERLTGKVSALAGPSGVGKSSLLNAIQPGLGLAVREISEAFQKGRHTTSVRQLFPLEGGGYVADTPGTALAGTVGHRAGGTGWLFPRTGSAGDGLPVQRLQPQDRAGLRSAGRRAGGQGASPAV